MCINRKNERNSNIEMLKIICILLIIAHHYSGYGGYEELSVDEFSYGVFWIQLLSLFGRLACSIFAMCTGFYMIDKVRNGHYRKIFPIFFQMMIYSWIVLLFFVCVIKEKIGIIAIVKAIFPMVWGNWYVVNYIILYMFIPIINLMLENIKGKTYTWLLAIIITVWCIVPTFTGNAWSFSSLDFLLVMYLIGGYLRRYIYGKCHYKNIYNLLISMACVICLILSVILIDVVAIIMNNDMLLQHATYFKSYNSILALPCAIFIFLYFVNFEFENKYINYIARSSLGIYLLHDNSLLKEIIWKRFWPNVHYVDNPYIHSIAKIGLVFILCFIVDVLYRETIGKCFDIWFGRHCDIWIENAKKMRLISKVFDGFGSNEI